MTPTHNLHSSNRCDQQGLTLVELLITVSIAALLMTLAVPSFTSFLRNWQRDGVTQSFTAHVQLARAEAIKSSRQVRMCPRNSATDCKDTNDWTSGWLVFVDTNLDGTLDTDERIVIDRGSVSGIDTMTSSDNIKELVFLPSGLMGNDATNVTVKSTDTALKTSSIRINRVGRTSVALQDPS